MHWRESAPVHRALLVLILLLPSVAAQDGPLTEQQRAWLDENGPIRIATPGATPPVGFTVEGEAVGMFPDLVELAALKVGASIELIPVQSLDDIAPMLDAGQVHLVGPLADRPDLMARAASDPVAWIPIVFVTSDAHPEFVDVADITGRTSTLPGSPMEQQLLTKFPHLEYVRTENATQGIAMLAAGELDSYYGPLVFLGYTAGQQGFASFRPVGENQGLVTLRMWGADDRSVPLSILQAGIERITDDEMRIIHAKWTGFDLTEPTTEAGGVPPWVLGAAIGLLVVALMSWGLVLVLRRQVRAATADLRTLNAELEVRIAQRTQELELRRQQVEASNERLERFAYMASHDLQAPLRHIASFAEFLVADLQGKLGPDDEENLQGIQEGVDRMRDRIQALLTFSRVQNTELEMEAVAMGDVVADAWRDLERDAVAAGATLEVGDLPVVQGDRSLLTQVMQNLLENAIRYRGDDPPVIAVHGDQDATFHMIHVIDNGKGFPPGSAERIFGMFRRLDEASSGSGIGLAICRVIIERHGGRIEAGGAPGEGSTFTIRLPK